MKGNRKWYIQVEAVNLVHFVEDTQDISSIRGGSYVLLNAIRNLGDILGKQINTVSEAASIGIYQFTGTENQLKRLVGNIYSSLSSSTKDQATFIVATQKDIPDDFQSVLERLQAKIRRDQWRMPTVVAPDSIPTDQECYLDGWRPGVVDFKLDPQNADVKISQSVYFRREEGREIKHRLFSELLGKEFNDTICAQDLEMLATEPSKGIANRKIAFIHLDGNNFGNIRHQTCNTHDLRSEYDRIIQQNCLHSFLRDLLIKADSEQDFKTRDRNGNEALRLEVLLYGGDEVILVVPAWKGWQTLDLFYRKAQRLSFKGRPLTYKGSMVICHHNAPILQIKRVAKDLQSKAKESILIRADQAGQTQLDHELGDAFHYLVLESFDMLRGSLDEFIQSYYYNSDYRNLLVNHGEMEAVSAALQALRKEIPRGKLLEIIQIIQNRRPDAKDAGREADLNLAVERILNLKPGETRSVVEEHIRVLTEKSDDRWYLLGDLWDYIPHWEENEKIL